MRVYRYQWRALQEASSISEAFTMAQDWKFTKTTLAKCREVSLPPSFLHVGNSDNAQRQAEELCEYNQYFARSVELICVPDLVLFPQNSSFLFGERYISDDLHYEEDVSGQADFIVTEGRDLSLHPEMVRKLSTSVEIPGNTLIIHPRYHQNYYHWHAEALSQLAFVNDNLDRFDRIAIPSPSGFRSSITDSLPSQKLIFINQDLTYRFEKAAISTAHFFSQAIHPSAATSLMSVVKQARLRLGVRPQQRRTIYLSRGSVGSRRMLNEEALAFALSLIGVETARPDMMSYTEQVRLFSEASLVIGAHGAGLTNMAYAPEGSRILELRPLNSKMHGSPLSDRAYRHFANLFGHQFGMIIQENPVSTDNWTVDVEFIASHIKNLL